MAEEKNIKVEDGNMTDNNSEKETVGQKEENTTDGNQNNAGNNDTKEENSAASGKESSEADDKKEEKDPLEAANEEIARLKDQLLRTIAEFDNYKKRTLKEKADLILNGGAKTVTAILPILDDMERAVKSASKAEDIAKLEEGWELIYKKFIKVLASLGVKEIETKDADFDTDYHEAVAMVPGMGDDKKGKVIDCVQTGYTMNDKVIRHAKVAVGQ